MKSKLGMPYMGNKRKLADKIINKILIDNPNVKYFYDLFGGGGSVSFCALQMPQFEKVVYNELNTGVVELLKDIRDNGVTAKYYQWVDKKTFDENKNKDTWFGGLCKVVWSFGNNQKSYLFGKDITENKRLGHEIVVNKDKTALKKLSNKLKIETPESIISEDYLFPKTIKQRRLELRKLMMSQKNRFDLQQLERLEQLEQLERLERLEQLQQLERLEIQNKSYEKVKIETPEAETVIYLDPPYKGTGKYQKAICHEKLLNWIKQSKYKVYVSSYEFDLPCVLEIEHRSSLSATVNKKVVEKLFSN